MHDCQTHCIRNFHGEREMDEYKWYLYLFLSKIRSLQSESCNRTGIEWLRLEKIINNGNWTQTIIKLSQGAGPSRLSPRNRLKINRIDIILFRLKNEMEIWMILGLFIEKNCEKPALCELIDTSESYSGVYFRKVSILLFSYIFRRKWEVMRQIMGVLIFVILVGHFLSLDSTTVHLSNPSTGDLNLNSVQKPMFIEIQN